MSNKRLPFQSAIGDKPASQKHFLLLGLQAKSRNMSFDREKKKLQTNPMVYPSSILLGLLRNLSKVLTNYVQSLDLKETPKRNMQNKKHPSVWHWQGWPSGVESFRTRLQGSGRPMTRLRNSQKVRELKVNSAFGSKRCPKVPRKNPNMPMLFLLTTN